ncbi:MAG: hypothetical protein ACKO9Z_09530, partial [Planctomycetota bacterium]
MLSLIRSLGLGTGKAAKPRKSFTPSLDILEGRVNPVVIATYNSGVIRISLTESNDNATIEKTD